MEKGELAEAHLLVAACPHAAAADAVFTPCACVAGESFFQEGLTRWRETNLSESFLSLAGKLHPLCATLPLLVLHQRAIVEALITRLVPDAALALEPMCSLAGLLARDLRGDFLPHVKPLVEAFARLLDAGADREPEHMVRAADGVTTQRIS